MRLFFIWSSVITLSLVGAISYFWPPILWSLVVIGPLVIIGIADITQTRQTLRRNYPVVGHGRYWMEKLRPKIFQYFVESDIDGRPINRILRSIVYQRAKQELSTNPFGTQVDVYQPGYEWINHSVYPKDQRGLEQNLRVKVGGRDCKKPYSANIYNISAMSYGALSKTAVMALNKGAHLGSFAHNTGEGGISPYHQKYGGDLIWQIGTGYFGCRDEKGHFSRNAFKEKACLEQMKMIEIKISQGAKPGHGGILPAEKNTPETAQIRGVKPHTQVVSPPFHSTFNSAEGLLDFVAELRELSGGKPVGFKMCLGQKQEFFDICKAMIKSGIKPDFVTIDGGEGGTGAAPLEFSNSVGTPLKDALAFVSDCLIGFDLKDEVKLIAAGKILTGFHMIRAFSLGVDICYSARGMMLALGCIQALTCNSNHCPTGIATQDPSLYNGINVDNKALRIKSFHAETVHSVLELLAAAGLTHPSQVKREHLYRRVNINEVKRFDEIYPYPEKGSYLQDEHPRELRLYSK